MEGVVGAIRVALERGDLANSGAVCVDKSALHFQVRAFA